ncbi:DNA glycosylase superfamily protein [Prunus dulcis]|uniref:DNA glycosylase superfamily protein n=1 Tax=Prunus dulcis TaxID=3755 RepID=A0A4Y1RY82_PRUDU|nr:DNA glycosylase superfamily protein [Prunus dulcis]
MDTVCGDGVEHFPASDQEGAAREAEVPADGVEPFPAMEVIDTEIETSVRERQVDQQPHKVPTSEDVKLPSVEDALLPTPEDGNGIGRRQKLRGWDANNITVVGDEGDNEATATVRKPDGEGKGCRLKRAATPLLSPFTDPSRKKRKVTDLHAQTPQPVLIQQNPWPWTIAELELEPFEVGADFFYKLLDETAWMSSRHLDMAMFLIRKRQLSHPQLFGREWTTAEFCLQPFAMPSGKRVTRKQSAARTVDPPLTTSKMYTTLSMGHGNMGMRKHGRKCASMLVRFMEPITHTLAKVLHEMRFYEKSEVEAVKRKGTDMSNFNPFTICRISMFLNKVMGKLCSFKSLYSDVINRCTSNLSTARVDSTSCGIMTVKYIEYLSAGIPLHTIDPSSLATTD